MYSQESITKIQEMKAQFALKSVKTLFGIFLVINLLACMSMKDGKKTDRIDRGPGVVWIKRDNYSPGNITVALNTTITWTNKDLWPHTVTSDTKLFDSGKIKSGDTFAYQFTTPGTFNYHCEIHHEMKGVIIVH
jgi:plastocyanin